MKDLLKVGAVVVVALAAVWGIYQGVFGGDEPSEAQKTRTQVTAEYEKRLERLQTIIDDLQSEARAADSAAAQAEARLDSVQERERRERRVAAEKRARAGESLHATLDSIAKVLPPVHRPLVERARAQLDTIQVAARRQIESLREELAATDEARRAQRKAKQKWRRVALRRDSALSVAEARADSLTASVDYWRGEATTGFAERFVSGYAHAAGKLAVEGLACWPKTGGVGECAAATAMLLADAALEGLP